MSTLSGIFNSGKSALFSNQRALTVTGQNIANVNTAGYNRQEVLFEPTEPLNERPGQLGTGVRIREIRRTLNKFVDNQVTVGKTNMGKIEADQTTLARVETTFNDSEGTGMNRSLTDLFGALQDISNNPQGRGERVLLIERSKNLVLKFATTNNQLQEVRKSLNSELAGIMNDVNQSAVQIADLNAQIGLGESGGQTANDLRDQRGRLVNSLAEKMDVTSFEDTNGQLTVLIGGGRPLVESTRVSKLSGLANPDNAGFLKVMFDPGTGSTADITSSIAGGRLKGLIDQRDNVLPGFINQLDQLAAGTINEINQQHKLGFGLDGSTGTDLFSPLAPTVTQSGNNSGSATVTAAITTPASLTLQPYELKFSGGTYTLKNTTTGASSSGASTIALEGLTVTMSGSVVEGDTFFVSAHKDFSKNISVAITDPNKIAAASASALTGTVTTTAGATAVTGTGTSFATQLKAGDTIVVGTDVYKIASIASDTALTLTGGAAVTVAGSAASRVQIPGDNTNATTLARLQDKAITPLGGTTIQDFYSGFTGEIGSRSQAARRRFDAEEVIQRQIGNLREGISGVSIDEEMTNLIRFQRAFEASARLITTTDELFQTILAMKR